MLYSIQFPSLHRLLKLRWFHNVPQADIKNRPAFWTDFNSRKTFLQLLLLKKCNFCSLSGYVLQLITRLNPHAQISIINPSGTIEHEEYMLKRPVISCPELDFLLFTTASEPGTWPLVLFWLRNEFKSPVLFFRYFCGVLSPFWRTASGAWSPGQPSPLYFSIWSFIHCPS